LRLALATIGWVGLVLGGALIGSGPAHAQIDPVQRRVFQAAYALPLKEHGPIAAYGFYYHNQPGFLQTNLTLRLAVVPVYLDAEVGIGEALGAQTDVAIGLSGGGFADSYNEIRRGDYLTEESFDGHAAEINASVYHLFNPGDRAPLYGILRGGFRGSFFNDDDDTSPQFEVPDTLGRFTVRAGLRLGGREPYLTPRLAGEFSLWYEGQVRMDASAYGYADDRAIEPQAHSFWGRALFASTFEESGRHLEVSVTAGAVLNADRLSAYRLGSFLPLVAEFPLSLPGYHVEEISADQFALLNAQYVHPIDHARRWNAFAFGSVAGVDYLDGLEQPGRWHSGVGGGMLFRSANGAWLFGAGYAHGFQAIREDDRGGHTVTVLVQYDLDALYREGGQPFWEPVLGTKVWQGLLRQIGGR
jgi:hypothetical protein